VTRRARHPAITLTNFASQLSDGHSLVNYIIGFSSLFKNHAATDVDVTKKGVFRRYYTCLTCGCITGIVF